MKSWFFGFLLMPVAAGWTERLRGATGALTGLLPIGLPGAAMGGGDPWPIAPMGTSAVRPSLPRVIASS